MLLLYFLPVPLQDILIFVHTCMEGKVFWKKSLLIVLPLNGSSIILIPPKTITYQNCNLQVEEIWKDFLIRMETQYNKCFQFKVLGLYKNNQMICSYL